MELTTGARARAAFVAVALACAVHPNGALGADARAGTAITAVRGAANTPAWEWRLPRGFPVPAVPGDNPMSSAKVELGRRLFGETRLSVTGQYSCASCHSPALAYTDGRATAIGATGGDVGRASMSLANVAYVPSFGWFEGGATTLEAQMRTPLYNEHPVEIGLTAREREVVETLRGDATYAAAFDAAFPDDASPVSIDNVIRAIATFERTLLSGDSAFDRYVFGGRHEALTAAAKRGMELFYSKRLGCGDCHGGFTLGGATRDLEHPEARATYAVDGIGSRRVRVPTLRNVALTAPYMHDGSLATLDDVIAHYERGGAAGSGRRRFALSAEDRVSLLEFLRSLTDRAFEAPQADSGEPHVAPPRDARITRAPHSSSARTDDVRPTSVRGCDRPRDIPTCDTARRRRSS